MCAAFAVARRYDVVVKRRLFNAVSLVSLVLCVATAALWVRSYFLADGLSNPSCPGRESEVLSINGCLIFATRTGWWITEWPDVHGWALPVSPASEYSPPPSATRLSFRCPECGTVPTKDDGASIRSAQAGRPGEIGGFIDVGPGPSGPG